jgi:hypothetical protein
MHLIVFAKPLENDFATSVTVGAGPYSEGAVTWAILPDIIICANNQATA